MRRTGKLLVVLAVVCTSMVVPARPSEAHNDICTVIGGVQFSTPFTATPPAATAAFTMAFTTGTCVQKGNLNLTGLITGTCGLAHGSGSTTNGHSFTVNWVGGELVFDGEVTGTFAIAPGPLENCLTGADVFSVAGTIVKSHVSLPASLCTGQFRLTLSGPFGVPPSSVTRSFGLEMTTGSCTADVLTMTGQLTGSCGVVMGSGTAGTGQTSSIIGSMLSLLGFTGGVEGSVLVTDDPFAPGTCTNGATEYLVTGALARP